MGTYGSYSIFILVHSRCSVVAAALHMLQRDDMRDLKVFTAVALLTVAALVDSSRRPFRSIKAPKGEDNFNSEACSVSYRNTLS